MLHSLCRTVDFQPQTELGRLGKTLNDRLTVFTDYWFGREAKKTNSGLFEIGPTVMMVYGTIIDIEKSSVTRFNVTLIDDLNAQNEKSLEKILRIPTKLSEEEKCAFKTARSEFVRAWITIRQFFTAMVEANAKRAQEA